jgi:dTDP-4-dehydrorhamnose 3,5-epimerase
MDGVVITPLRVIPSPGGTVLHGMKKGDVGESGFGEAYFSTVEQGFVKGWKRHRRMTLNLIVPQGEVRFVLHDTRPGSVSEGRFLEVRLSRQNYARLTVPPGLWMAFQSTGETPGMLLNIADIAHDPVEVDRLELNEIEFDWSL